MAVANVRGGALGEFDATGETDYGATKALGVRMRVGCVYFRR